MMEWIKKGEQNPSIHGQAVLVSTKHDAVMEAWGDFYGLYRNQTKITDEVIAWMPLPKPYSEK